MNTKKNSQHEEIIAWLFVAAAIYAIAKLTFWF